MENDVTPLHPSLAQAANGGADPKPTPEAHTVTTDVPPSEAPPSDDAQTATLSRAQALPEDAVTNAQRRAATAAETQAAVNKFVAQYNALHEMLTPAQASLLKAARRNVKEAIAKEVARVKKRGGAPVAGLALEHFFIIDFFHDLKTEIMQALTESDVFSLDEYCILETAAYLRAYTAAMKRGMNPTEAGKLDMGLSTVGTQEVPVNFSITPATSLPRFLPDPAKADIVNLADFRKK